MNKIVRTSAPQWLKDKWKDWGEKWENKYAQAKNIGKSIQFAWPQVDKEKVDKKLQPLLSEMTKAHCSFCDAYPMESLTHDKMEKIIL